jgi:hypothetical protein
MNVSNQLRAQDIFKYRNETIITAYWQKLHYWISTSSLNYPLYYNYFFWQFFNAFLLVVLKLALSLESVFS